MGVSPALVRPRLLLGFRGVLGGNVPDGIQEAFGVANVAGVRAHLMSFVTRLRRAGVRISVAETLDAMAAVEAAGVERTVLREALAATLVKDEEDRGAFDAAFEQHFPLLGLDGSTGKGTRRGPRSGGEGEASGATRGGSGAGSGGAGAPSPERDAPPATERPARPAARSADAPPSAARRDASAKAVSRATADEHAAQRGREQDAARAAEQRAPALPTGADRRGTIRSERSTAGADDPPPRAPVARRPFSDLDPDALDAARTAAREIGRRFLARTSRRMRRTRRGRIDVRRTIRRAVSRGGALIDLERKGRRPGKPDLVVLCDVSGSVARASELLLTMLAAAEGAFAHVARFVFVDHLVAVDFADGQIRPEGELDLYGFSDLGTVLVELERTGDVALDRRTVLLVLGDARNNRRPARADALRRLAQRTRAVVWAVPEPRARWNTGDSALASYAPSCALVVEATSLAGLHAALREAAD